MKPVHIHLKSLFINSIENAIPAGFPIPHTDAANSSVDLNEHLLINPHSSFLFRVSGDSMINVGIFDGDRIIVDRSIEPQHNHIVLAVVDNEYTVKRFCSKNGLVRLLPENDAYEPIDFEDGQVLQIWGVVTANLRKFL